MKKRALFIFGLLIFLILASFYFDSEIIKGISFVRNSFLDNSFMKIISASSEIIIFLFLTGLFLWKKQKRKWIIPLWLTLASSAIFSFLLKVSVQRDRPFQLGIVSTLPVLERASHLIWNFSFPSSHAVLVFCALPVLSKEFPKFKYLWIGFVTLVAFSRVYFGLHFLSDVMAGGLIGYLIGALIIKIEKEEKFSEKIYRKIFGR